MFLKAKNYYSNSEFTVEEELEEGSIHPNASGNSLFLMKVMDFIPHYQHKLPQNHSNLQLMIETCVIF